MGEFEFFRLFLGRGPDLGWLGHVSSSTLYTSRHNNPHPRLQQPRSAAGKKGDYENLLQEMKAKQAEARGSFHILGVRRRRE